MRKGNKNKAQAVKPPGEAKPLAAPEIPGNAVGPPPAVATTAPPPAATERAEAAKGWSQMSMNDPNLAPVGYLTLSEPGLILEANLTAATLLGVPRGALVKQPITRFIHKEDEDLYHPHRKELFETGAPQSCELRLVRKDGTMLWAHLAATAAQDEEGARVSRVVMSDITERKKAEAVQVFLAKTSSGSSAEPFFPALAHFLAQSLGMDFVCIDRLEGDGLNARTVAVWCDGQFQDNVTYALKDTPCGEVVGKQVCCFPASVCQFFPRDQVLQDLRAESYVGVTLWSHVGKPIGLIAVISRRPLPNRGLAEATLRTAGLRAAAELERLDEESALQFSNALLSTQQEASMDGILVVDENAHILSYNRRFIELWGLPAKLVEDRADEPVLAFVMAQIADLQAFLERTRHLYEHPHEIGRDELLLTDGRTFDRYTAPMFGAGERYYGRAWYFRDITERKRADEALRESERNFHTLAEVVPQIVWATRPDGWNIYFNQHWVDYTGLTLEESYGHGWNKPFHPEDQQRAWKAWQKATQDNSTYSLECRLRRADGAYRWWLIRGEPLRDASGKILKWFGTCTDIEDLKQKDEQLAQLDHQKGLILNSAAEGILGLDLKGNHTFINPAAVKMLGYLPEELIGRPSHSLWHHTRPDGTPFPQNQCAISAAYRDGLTQRASDEVFWRKDGTSFPVEYTSTPIYEQSRLVGAVVTFEDITEKKQLEEQLLRSQRMEGIGSLAGGIAHDLNNILAPVLMAAPFLRQEIDERERNKLIDIVEASAQRGADIIKQLLTFARGQPGARAPMPARLLLNEMGRLIRETFPRNITLHVNSPTDLWPALGDATQFHQTLLNLCVNARDAMPEGGTLTLGASNVNVGPGFAATALEARPGAYLCVSVADTGTGIAPENLHRIFDPFFTTKELGKGTGLGLATLLGIMRGHEGFIRVESQPGSGTTFEVYFPAVPAPEALDAPERAAPPPRGQGELILIVDDESALLSVTHRTLERYGYRVVTAEAGEQALAIFASRGAEIKAVVTDMMMPGMDGPKLVRALRQLNAQLPVLGMTGLADRVDAAKLEGLNLAALLKKPFAGVELLAALHEALLRRRGRKDAAGL